MNLIRFVFLLSTLLTSISVSFANNDFSISNKKYSVGFDVGLSDPTHLGNSTQFPLGYSTFQYSAKNDSVYPFTYGVSFNRNINLTALYTLQVGLSYHYLTQTAVNGNLEQGISPPYYQSTYSYSIHSSQLLAEAKMIYQWHTYYPYLMIGLGGASNTAKDYATKVPDYLTFTPDYANKTTQAFSYAVGFGVNYFIAPKVTIGAGYRFSDLGKVGLGKGNLLGIEIPSKLKQSNLYINTLLVQLNYFL